MGKFFHTNDLGFIKTISEEVVDYLVEQWATLYKLSVGESKVNIYGESLGKIYHSPATLMCLVERDPRNITYDGFGPDVEQPIEFRFNRQRLRTHEIPYIKDIHGQPTPVGSIQNLKYGYPEIGDIVFYDGQYYEIANVRENRLIGGMTTMYDKYNTESEDTRMELIASAFLVRKSQVQIEDNHY